MRISTTIFLTLLCAGYSLADDVTIPNTFTAGTPARAADVNGNFTAVEASVDDNAAGVQANAAAIALIEEGFVQPYIFDAFCEDSSVFPATDSLCYFDVPEGKVLRIEHVSGFTRKGNVMYLAIQSDPTGGGTVNTAYRIPRIISEPANYIYDADGAAHAKNDNIFTDGVGAIHDFRVIVKTDGVGPDDGLSTCTVAGRLFNAAP